MFKHIKNKIKDYFDRKLNSLHKKQELLHQRAFDHRQISQLFNGDIFIPLTTWSLPPEMLSHVLNDIVVNRRKSIIEFGAGASTLYIAKLLQTIGREIQFYSIESDQAWAEELNEQLLAYGLNNYVDIIYAPIAPCRENLLFKEQRTWYDTEILGSQIAPGQQFDLVLVDGPFGGSTPFARYSAIPFLKDRFYKNYSIFCDDVKRADEKECVDQWKQELGSKLEFFNRYAFLHSGNNFDSTPFKVKDIKPESFSWNL